MVPLLLGTPKPAFRPKPETHVQRQPWGARGVWQAAVRLLIARHLQAVRACVWGLLPGALPKGPCRYMVYTWAFGIWEPLWGLSIYYMPTWTLWVSIENKGLVCYIGIA